MRHDYALYVNNAIKEALADRDYESQSAEELLLLCQLLTDVCWFSSSNEQGCPPMWVEKTVQDKLEKITNS